MGPDLGSADQRRLQLVHQLRAISVQLDQARAAFGRAYGLHDTDVRALICLLDAERAKVPATPGWLGSQLGLTSPATTALIDRLQAAGHVHRQPSPTDRRKVEIRVSQQAISLGWDFFGPLLTGMIAAMRPFSPAELDTIERFLHEVAAVTRWQDDLTARASAPEQPLPPARRGNSRPPSPVHQPTRIRAPKRGRQGRPA